MIKILLDMATKIFDLFTDFIIFYKSKIHPILDIYVIDPFKTIFNLKLKKFNVIKNDIIIQKTNFIEEINLIDYDMIIEKNKENLCRIHLPNNSNNSNNMNDETPILKSEFKFLSFSIKFKNKRYFIDFEKPLYFLCKDNYFDNRFFKFYMMYIYKIKLDDDYTIDYVSNKMQIKSNEKDLNFKIQEKDCLFL